MRLEMRPEVRGATGLINEVVDSDAIPGAADVVGGVMGPQRPYLRVRDAANLMRVTEKTIRNMIEDGRLRAGHFGSVVLIHTSSLLDLVKPIQPKKQRTQNGSSQESRDGNGSSAQE